MTATNPQRDQILTIAKIAERALAAGYPGKKLDVMMDIEYTHEVCPLDLEALLAADDDNFAHDVFGIYRHFDRSTLTLTDCFCPRYARKGGDA